MRPVYSALMTVFEKHNMTAVKNPKIKPLVVGSDEGCTSDVRHFMLMWWN
jgi:hypothetical protein